MADRFQGGPHTDTKISALSAYLKAYSTALKNQGFALVYIDAFAGSGSYSKSNDSASLSWGMLGEAGTISMPGSARIALEMDPPFDLVVFIEKDAEAAKELQALVQEYPKRKHLIYKEDANERLVNLCSTTYWMRRSLEFKGIRAVLFLDPFAISVDWSTLVEIGKTRAVDVWFLLNVNAIGRLLQHDLANMPLHNREHLDRIFGEGGWESTFYKPAPQQGGLFGEEICGIVRDASPEKIERAFIERLKDHFGYVHPRGLRLKKDGQHWFSLLFMMASRVPAAHDLGKKFARSIIDAPQGTTRRR